MSRTRAECEADITIALADQRLADLVGDEEAEQQAEHRMAELFEEYAHIPLPRRPAT